MAVPFASFCDDFYVNMRLGSQLSLPHSRETVLHYFERVQKEYPNMSRFRKAERLLCCSGLAKPSAWLGVVCVRDHGRIRCIVL